MTRLVYLLLGTLLIATAHGQNPLDRLLKYRDLLPFDRDDRRDTVQATAFEVRSTESGRGTLSLRGPNHVLDRAAVTLTRDGRAEIRVSGRQNFRFAGTWRRGKANQALLTIAQTFERSPASATGSVTLRNGTFHQLYLKGSSLALEGPLVLKFTASVSASQPVERFSLDNTRRGRGVFATSRTNSRLSQARLLLQRDGDARLSVYGESGYEFAGAWSRRNANVIDLRLTRGPNRSRIDLFGSVTLSKQGFSKFEVKGDAPALGGRARITFTGSDREYIDRRNRYRGNEAALGGDGIIRIRGKNWRLNTGSVKLYQNGNAFLTFKGKYPYTIEGTWFACHDSSALELEIDQLNNRPADAVGKLLIHRNGEVHGVEMQGRADAASGAFNLTYRLAGHTNEEEHGRHPSRKAQGSLTADEVGVGTYESRATKTTLTRAQIRLRPDGAAGLTFSGRDTLTFGGTWTPVREGFAQVQLTRLQNRIPVTGTATIQYRGTRVLAVSLSGSSRQRGRFDLSFSTGRQQQQKQIQRKWKFGRGLKDQLKDLF